MNICNQWPKSGIEGSFPHINGLCPYLLLIFILLQTSNIYFLKNKAGISLLDDVNPENIW